MQLRYTRSLTICALRMWEMLQSARRSRSVPGGSFFHLQLPWATLVIVAVLLCIGLLYTTLAAIYGVRGTNDGSHYALIKALAVDHRARIDPYVRYTAIPAPSGVPTPDGYLYLDLSFKDGHFYSDRAPGLAFLAVPCYWLGSLAEAITGDRSLNLPQHGVMLLPPLFGVLTMVALYALAIRLGASVPAAVFTAVSGALTTLLFKYATRLLSHSGGALCVTAALALLLTAEGRSRWRGWLLAASGAALGYGAVIEYPNLLLVIPVGGYLLWRAYRHRRDRPFWRDVASFGVGWLGPVSLLLGYNWAVFGRPWDTSYTYQYYFTWSHQLTTTYVNPPWIGLLWLLLSPSGLLPTTPAILLALVGLLLLARQSRAKALLLGGVILAILLPTSAHRTFYGGQSNDTRYLLAIVPVIYAPLALFVDAAVGLQSAMQRYLLVASVAALTGWGLVFTGLPFIQKILRLM